MPPNLVPHRSGVHRAACKSSSTTNVWFESSLLDYLGFALFRALLRQKNSLPLDDGQRSVLHSAVKATFKKNTSLNATSKITATLRLGYKVRVKVIAFAVDRSPN